MTSSRASRAGVALSALMALTCAGGLVSPTADAQSIDRPRVRFGLSGFGGGFVGTIHGAVGGVSPRIGLQANDVFAVYVQAQYVLGQFLPEPSDDLVGFVFHTLVFELTADDFLQIGLGPSLDFVWGCDELLQRVCAGSRPRFGSDAHLAFLVGDRAEERRSRLAISLDVHPTWFDGDVAVAILAGIGYERR